MNWFIPALVKKGRARVVRDQARRADRGVAPVDEKLCEGATKRVGVHLGIQVTDRGEGRFRVRG